MKKLLALVLAMVMTLGLATVSASAAPTVKYADKDDIGYLEAADVLSEVGVFNGKGENFAPKDNLNRAEAAKLVAYLMLGNKTAETITGNGNKFADVPADHYAAGYIEYLATAGVVSGVGGGNFNPNGPVTAVQFGKMLCVALGYDAQVEGFVGESWNINIMKQANDDKLFKTLDVGANDVLTREQAAQMCLNALKARTVEYESKGDTLQINNSTVILNAKKAKDKTTGDTKGHAINWDRNTAAAEWYLNLGEDLYNGDLKMEKTHDDFGRPANKWTYKSHDIGTYADSGDLKGEYTDEVKNGPVYDLVGKTVYDDLKNGNSVLMYWEDGEDFVVTPSDVDKFILKNGDTALSKGYGPNANTTNASTGRGTLTQVYVNDDTNDVTITAINTYVFKASSDYRTSTEDIVIGVPSGAVTKALDSTRLELVDFPSIKDMKKDDYILATLYQNSNGNNYTVKTAVKAELLTAKVDKYVKDDTVTLDGTTYKYDKKIDDTSKGTEYSIGQETTVVMDKYGYIMYVDEAVVSANYVFISELYQNGGNTSKVQANAYFTDGTNQTITVKEIDGTSDKTTLLTKYNKGALTSPHPFIGVVSEEQYFTGWYTYNKNSSGEYTMNKLGNTYKQEIERFTTSTATKLTASDKVQFIENGNAVAANTYKYDSAVTAKSAKANDKTIFVVTYKDKNDVDVYTGVKNLPEINLATDNSTQSSGTVFSVLDNKGYAKYVFASVDGKYSVFGSENESLLYIIKLDKKNVISSDTTYYTYKALDENAKEIKVEGDGNNAFNNATYKTFYKTSKNADGRYTRGEAVPNTGKYVSLSDQTGAITASNGTLSIAGQSFTLGDNYKLVVVSQADALNKKQGADYEANVVTAEGLDAMVSGYAVTYNFEAKKDSTTNMKLVEAYVTITAAVPTGASSGSSATSASGILAVRLGSSMRGLGGDVSFSSDVATNEIKVYYSGSVTPSKADIAEAITSEFAKYSDLDDYYVVYEQVSGTTTYQYSVYKDGVYQDKLIAQSDATTPTYGIRNPIKADLTSSKSWTITSDTAVSGVLVVPEGVKLTVDGANVTGVTELIVAGDIEIKNNGSIAITGNYQILKTGHVTITKGTFDATSKPGTIEGNSLVASSDSLNVVKLGNVAVTGLLDIEGGRLEAHTVTNFGTTKLGGTTNFAAGTITAEAGGTTTVASTVVGSGTLNNNGGSTTIGTTKTSGNETPATLTAASNATIAAVNWAEATAMSNLTWNGSAYAVTSDSAAISLTLKNTSGSAQTPSVANPNSENWNDATYSVSGSVANGSSVTVNFSKKTT